MLAAVIPVQDFDALAAKDGAHVLPDPLGSIANDHNAAQHGFLSTTVCAQPSPAADVQCSASGRLGAQTGRKAGRRLARRHVTRVDQLAVLPITRQAQLDLVPLSLDQRAIQMVIGRLEIGEWTTREGESRTSYDIWADDVVNLSPREDAPRGQGESASSAPNEPAVQPVGVGARRVSTEDTTDLEDLPF